MKLYQLGEFGLIDRIAKREKVRAETVVGIGDDAAVVKLKTKDRRPKTKYLLITTDTFIENIHFKLKTDSFFYLGQKVLAANISDIAAMGGYPTHALVTVGFPKMMRVEKVDELYRGIDLLAKKFKIDIIGGDTVQSPKEVVVGMVVLGEVEKECLLTRSKAKVGDAILVTGNFGGPASLKFVYRLSSPACRQAGIVLRLREARIIAKSGLATSMIDSSDGLVRSILEVCKASKVGARIWLDSVPIAKGANLSQALYGGEEYELIFTVPRIRAVEIINLFRKEKTKVSIVGEIVSKKHGVKLVDIRGKVLPLEGGGYEHFK